MNPVKTPLDPKAVKLLANYDVPGILYGLAVSGDGKTLYGAGQDGALHSVDLQADKQKVVKQNPFHDNYVSSLVWHDGVLISGSYDRQIHWTDPKTGNCVRSIIAHDGWVRKIAIMPDTKHLVSIGDDMRVNVWDSRDGKRLASMTGHEARTPEGYLSAMYALAVSPDGRHIASGDRAGFVCVWDLSTGKTVSAFRATDFYTFDAQKRARAIGGVRGLCFSADGNRLAISGIGSVTNVDGFVGPCRLEWWDWKAAKRLMVGQDKHLAILNHVILGIDEKSLIAVGGGDGGGAMVFWNGTDAPPQVAKPKGHLQAVLLNPADNRLYAVGHGGFQVWEMDESPKGNPDPRRLLPF